MQAMLKYVKPCVEARSITQTLVEEIEAKYETEYPVGVLELIGLLTQLDDEENQ